MEFYLKHPIAVTACYDLVVQNSLLATWHFAVVCPGRIGLLIASEPMGERAFRLNRFFRHNGPIYLAQRARTKKLTQSAQSLTGTGKEHDTTHRAIEPMHQTKEYIAGLVVALGNVLLYRIQKRGVASLIALHDLTRFLGYDNYVIIFV